jgi:hypothetical protein
MKVPESKLDLVLKVAIVLAMLGALAGCGKGGAPITFTVPPPTPPTISTVTNPAIVAKNAYVCDPMNNTVDVYAANINGVAALKSSFSIASGGSLAGVALDAAGNLYLSETLGTKNQIEVFAPGSSVASRTIVVNGAQILGGYGMGGPFTVDAPGNVYVAVTNPTTTPAVQSILVYGPTANGAATPLRTITGPLTQIENPTQLALDSSGDLYVAMQKTDIDGPPTLVMYPAGASGNIAPTLVTTTQYAVDAVALDGLDNIYITSGGTVTSPYPNAIYEFAAGSKAGAAPIRTITGSNVLLNYADFLQVDAAGNIFVSGFWGSQSFASGEPIYVYAATASGNVAPASTLETYRSAESSFYLK